MSNNLSLKRITLGSFETSLTTANTFSITCQETWILKPTEVGKTEPEGRITISVLLEGSSNYWLP